MVPTMIYQTIQIHDDGLKLNYVTFVLKRRRRGNTARTGLFTELVTAKKFSLYGFQYDNKQLLDELFVISGIMKVIEVSVISRAEGQG